MPRYHFDLQGGLGSLDPDGTEFPDVEAAQAEAMRFVGELFISEGTRLASAGGCCLVVKDQHGVARFRLGVTVALQPSFRPAPGS